MASCFQHLKHKCISYICKTLTYSERFMVYSIDLHYTGKFITYIVQPLLDSN